jgi:hypothetical protein
MRLVNVGRFQSRGRRDEDEVEKRHFRERLDLLAASTANGGAAV